MALMDTKGQSCEGYDEIGKNSFYAMGQLYAMLKGSHDQASRIGMAQRWSQDVCRQLGNNISDELVASFS